MKTQNRLFKLVILFLTISLGSVSCTKDEVIPPVEVIDTDKDGIIDSLDKCPNEAAPGTSDGCPLNIDGGELELGEGLDPEDLDPYQGDIGIVVDARKVAKKGYKPVKVVLDIEATSGDYSQTIELNEYALMGQIRFSVADLSAMALQELQDGVQVVATLLDANGATILTESLSKLSFLSNPLPNTIQGNELADLNTDVNLIPNTPYYIQKVVDGVPTGTALFQRMVLGGFGNHNRIISTTSTLDLNGDEDNALFYFEEVPNKPNHYNIKHIGTNSYLKQRDRRILRVRNTNANRLVDVVEAGHNSPHLLNHQFIIKKVNSGEYRMTDAFGAPIQVTTGIGLTLNYTDANVFGPTSDITFRFVPMNIDWKVENISGGTEYLPPVLPAASTGFNYNGTLINCGPGTLTDEVGKGEEKVTQNTVGWQETLSMASSFTSEVTMGVSLEVEGKFFGNGATYSASADYTNSATVSSAVENTEWGESTGSHTETYFSTKTVVVPPKSAVLVVNAWHSYKDVKVNIVKRLRVKGNEHDTGASLTGEQISTQFSVNGFQGHITEIGADYIEITLRGVATMDEIYESFSKVEEVDPMCSN
ncbi:hypothetical protein FEE95_15045 [Maribacter algarum]|uniref:Thrombospondin type 3 repeat-containing protein n=1 Tax=Maribacter algarum (ex Zhang et al. 2020) TaxID=2578118 RepID=A0A5S3QFB0_9FLAO|nr:hypothetical protein [Maribacter algarum]TMM55957.1 hypothetical protein FEE95_15045 [Maribacter algarum]